MHIVIKSRHMQITPHLRARIERKLRRLERWTGEDTRVEVTVAEEQTRCANDRYSVQIALSGDTHSIHSEVSALNASTALDLVIDKVVVQLSRQKARLTTIRHHHATPIKVLELTRAGFISSPDEEAMTEEMPLEMDMDHNEEIWSRVLEIRRLPTRPMTDHEVIEQMEKDGNTFYPFVNPETNSVNVMYRLDQGGYGLLIPAQE
jgi:putative sigma-54 modulation protein